LIRLSDYTVSPYLIDTVDIQIKLHPTQTRVIVQSHMRPNPERLPGVLPLHLDGDELTLTSISMNGAALTADAYAASAEALIVKAPPQQPFTLTIETVIDPTANSKLMGLYRSNGVYCTQCEADGFRRISYFLDRPDVMATYRVRLEAERVDAPILLANGNLIDQGNIPDSNRHYTVWDDPHPKPCYLFAAVGGDLGHISDSFTTSEGRTVALGIYVEKGKEDQTHYAMDALKRSMRWDETAFGLAYDLDVFNIVAVSDFNMGAMENKGLNIFNDKYVLASSETATDSDYALIEAIIAHEYFHNWTGNRITCRDWFQLCLKEGLTVFRDQEFSSDMRSRAVKRIMDVKELRSRQFVEDAGPLAHPVRPNAYREINNFYTATVYEKGAEVIRMLKLIIGETDFKRGMDLYFTRHDGHAATIEQFIACFAEMSGKDLTHFSQWYDQAGTPMVTVARNYDASTKTWSLKFNQSTPPTPGQQAKKPQVIPIALGFVNSAPQNDSSQMPAAKTKLFILDETEKTYSVSGLEASEVPSLLRGFSAPVNLELDLTPVELFALAQNDPDPFNRWQSLQTIAMQILVQSTTALQNGQSALPHEGLGKAVQNLLVEGEKDPAFTALVVSMPSEQDIAREMKTNIDPDAIHLARKTLRSSIAGSCFDTAQTLYERLTSNSDYAPDAASAGKRALRNAALELMIVSDAKQGGQTALRQLTTANNMTDRFAALASLVYSGSTLREDALFNFERQYKDNPLVMDKWFALQAAIPETETLERVQKLVSHPAFSLTNPNRARSLLGGFAMSNPTQFNRPDGEGYRFIGRFVIAIDKKNPQVSARITTAFRSWRTLEPGRQAKAQQTLLDLSAHKTLSRDLRDIVDRMLT
jgi:aminopeptidase N